MLVWKFSNIPSPARGPRETFSLTASFLVLGAIATVVGCGWNTEKEKKTLDRDALDERKVGVCPSESSVL